MVTEMATGNRMSFKLLNCQLEKSKANDEIKEKQNQTMISRIDYFSLLPL